MTLSPFQPPTSTKKYREVTERDVLTTSVLHWRQLGTVPTTDDICNYLEASPVDVQLIMELPDFKMHWVEKGLPDPERKLLSPRQIMAITILLNPVDGRSFQQKLDEAEVNPDTYANWMKQPEFRKAMENIGESNINDAMPAILNKLTEKAINGNQRSIELVLEMQGRYNPRAQDDFNPQLMMGQFLEILMRVLSDQPEKLMEISNQLDTVTVKGELGR